MKIKTNTGLAGESFAYSSGQIVDQDEFAANVGSGWERLCEPFTERAVKPAASETAAPAPLRQKAVKASTKETR